MSNLRKLAKLKEKLTTLQSEADKSQGALEAILTTLKDKFKCDSIDEAQEMLDSMEIEEHELEETFGKALTQFESKWGSLL